MIIVITGASRGIGFAIAEKFAAEDASHLIVMISKQPQALQEAADALRKKYPVQAFLQYPCNLADKAAVQELGNFVLQQVGTPDVLVNNAGYFLPGSVHSEPDGTLEEMLHVNLLSAYHLSRALLPAMIDNKSGHVFNICSIASVQAYANGGSYSISKFAMLGFGKNLREEMKPYGIKVTNILPGAVYTDSWAGSSVQKERIMEAQDVATLVQSAARLSPQACVEDIVLRPQLGDL